MTPYDVFDFSIAEKIKDTGECWLWESTVSREGSPLHYCLDDKGVSRKHHVQSIAYRRVNDTDLLSLKLLQTCRERLCVHPYHQTHVSTDAGTMLRIRKASDIRGDCWIWTAGLNGGAPSISRGTHAGARKLERLSVRAFVYCMEHGIEWMPNLGMKFELTCGNDLCVSFKHLRRIERWPGGKCDRGHDVKADATRCHACKHESSYEPRPCRRGHSGRYRIQNTGDGCDLCNREDAEQYLRDTGRAFIERWSSYRSGSSC